MGIKISKRDNLDRYYLLKLFGYGIFLHHIHHSEEAGVYHSHPWNGVSIILGSYREQRLGEPLTSRMFLNLIKAKRFHRVEVDKPVWSIFFHGRRCNQWQVCNESGEILSTEPWRGIGGKTSYH